MSRQSTLPDLITVTTSGPSKLDFFQSPVTKHLLRHNVLLSIQFPNIIISSDAIHFFFFYYDRLIVFDEARRFGNLFFFLLQARKAHTLADPLDKGRSHVCNM
jgi:hypothetical protein